MGHGAWDNRELQAGWASPCKLLPVREPFSPHFYWLTSHLQANYKEACPSKLEASAVCGGQIGFSQASSHLMVQRGPLGCCFKMCLHRVFFSLIPVPTERVRDVSDDVFLRFTSLDWCRNACASNLRSLKQPNFWIQSLHQRRGRSAMLMWGWANVRQIYWATVIDLGRSFEVFLLWWLTTQGGMLIITLFQSVELPVSSPSAAHLSRLHTDSWEWYSIREKKMKGYSSAVSVLLLFLFFYW